ncbi:MAG: PspC domain-containing protein [Chryseotalea sp.]|jgi:phage shock protein PspC (stress-responsive transcriptional regulator)
MKKNISINISGIIFHIEEDGYDLLRKYLDSVNRYFASFEDSAEILADIEGRMAEIFLGKLSESKQVITAEDVNNLMAVMGSVNDFKAAEQTENTTEFKSENTKQNEPESKATFTQGGHYKNTSQGKQLFRDQRRKILGGVCAGLANYFNVDAVWIRLLFVLLLFAYGTAFIAYLILWVAVPGSVELEEPTDTKKMYRDPERKVLGGVAAGVAAYFNLDIAIVRILFLVGLFFFGTGFILYFVLWIVLPEARSITERMQMQGEPVTLSNIESNIKKNVQFESSRDESTLTKIILLPFRALGAIITALGKVLVPIAEVVRVMVGILLTIICVLTLVAIVIGGSVLVGLLSSVPDWLQIGFKSDLSFPIEAFMNSFSPITLVACFVAAIIPVLFFLLLGISIIARRYVFNAVVGWSFFGLWLASVIVLGISIPRIVYGFKESGEVKKEIVFNPSGTKPILRVKPAGMEDYDNISLTLKGHEQNQFLLVQKFKAQGTNQQDAIANADMISYVVSQQDSILIFDSNFTFNKDAIFRGQELEMVLFIPFEKPFIMETAMARFISQYIDWDNLDSKTWKMTVNGLRCIDCEGSVAESLNQEWSFENIEVTGLADLVVEYAETYQVEITGDNEEKDLYTIKQEGNKLVINYDKFSDSSSVDWSNNLFETSTVKIRIGTPKLEELKSKGAGKIRLDGFTNEDLTINLTGAFQCKGNLTAQNLTVALVGASELELKGNCNNLEARLAGASKLKAYEFETQDATVDVVGVSSAKIFVTNALEIKETVGSKVSYRGNPQTVKKNN